MTALVKKDSYIELGEIIKKRGIKVKHVAKQIGIAPNYLGAVLSGRRSMSTDVAINASKVLGLPLDYFLNKS